MTTFFSFVQLDGPFAAVCFPKTNQPVGRSQSNEESASIAGKLMDVDVESGSNEAGGVLKQLFGQMRLLRVEDLQVGGISLVCMFWHSACWWLALHALCLPEVGVE